MELGLRDAYREKWVLQQATIKTGPGGSRGSGEKRDEDGAQSDIPRLHHTSSSEIVVILSARLLGLTTSIPSTYLPFGCLSLHQWFVHSNSRGGCYTLDAMLKACV